MDVDELERRPEWSKHHYLRIEAMDHESNYLLDPPRTGERSQQQLQAALPRMLDPTLDFFEVFVRGNGSPDVNPEGDVEAGRHTGTPHR